MHISKTGIISDPIMLEHRSLKRHPECPERLSFILQALEQAHLLNHPHIDYVSSITKQVDEELLLVHTKKYIDYVANLWPKKSILSQISVFDSYFSSLSHTAARLSAGGVLEAVDNIMSGRWANGYAVVRPPGHHSGFRKTLNGFCVFNNVAIAARYLRQKYNVKRIAVVDWDVHHGDGTQYIFNEDKDLLFVSIHRHDRGIFYPAGDFGSHTSCGKGEAVGSTINIPLSGLDKDGKEFTFQSPGDNQYIYIFHRMIEPILKAFNPQFILVSSGFDAARNDALGGLTLTPNAYFYMTHRLLSIQPNCLLVLEGGYNLQSIGQASCAVVNALLKQREQFPQPITNITLKNIHLHCHLQDQYHSQLDQIIQFYTTYYKQLDELMEYTALIKKNKEKCFGVVEEEESEEQGSEHLETNTFVMAGGHSNMFKVFTPKDKWLWKRASEEEVNFYIREDAPEIKFAPAFKGKEGMYMVIANLLYQLQEYTVVDVKLSNSLHNPHRDKSKDQTEKIRAEQSATHKYLFRITGCTTHNFKEGRATITKDQDIIDMMKKVVDHQNKLIYIEFIQKLIATLKVIKRKFYHTSLLFIKGKTESRIGWIDFHYWYESEQCDEDLIQGLNNLLKFIKIIQ